MMRQVSTIINSLSTEQLLTLRAEIDKKIQNRLHFKQLNQSKHIGIIDGCFNNIIEDHGFTRTSAHYSKSGKILTIDYELVDERNRDLNLHFSQIHVDDLIRANKRLCSEYNGGFYISLSSISNINKFINLNPRHKRLTGTDFYYFKTIPIDELSSYIGHTVVLSLRVKIDFNKTINGI